MHEINVYTHFFFVPNRLVFGKWERFITGGEDGRDSTPFPVMVAPSTSGYAEGSLADYFGLVPGVPDYEHSALQFRAYALVYNEWYRDQNLQEKIPISLDPGLDTITNTELLNRNWEKDYFTSALPWSQRGDPALLPLGSVAPLVPVSAPVNTTSSTQYYTLDSDLVFSVLNGFNWVAAPSGSVVYNGQTFSHSGSGFSSTATLSISGSSFSGTATWYDDGWQSSYSSGSVTLHGSPSTMSVDLSGVYSDLSTATAVSVNDLRFAVQAQVFMELMARSGSRYVEYLLAHFGVRSSDSRLQRPEYLGGGKSPFVVSEVLQTSSTDSTSPQGNMAGHGISAHRAHGFVKSFEEHGFILGIMSIMPRTSYQQGLVRQWNRRTLYDFYVPAFAHLGEQAVFNKELYVASAQPDGVFGYQGRFDELRRSENTVHGQFRSSLDYWHMGRIFATEPVLNSSFVTADPTMRVQAVTDEPNCLVEIVHHVTAIRPLPFIGEPGRLDHRFI
jgi:hypothetical protein